MRCDEQARVGVEALARVCFFPGGLTCGRGMRAGAAISTVKLGVKRPWKVVDATPGPPLKEETRRLQGVLESVEANGGWLGSVLGSASPEFRKNQELWVMLSHTVAMMKRQDSDQG